MIFICQSFVVFYLGNLFAFSRLSIFVNDMFAFNSTHLFFHLLLRAFHFYLLCYTIAHRDSRRDDAPQTHQKNLGNSESDSVQHFNKSGLR